MNETYIGKIKENYQYFGGISFLYGIFFAFCFYKNIYGITFPLCVIGTLFVYNLFLKKIGLKIKKGSIRYIAGMVLLGFATSLTTNFFLVFFNWIGCVLLFILFMIHQFYNDLEWQFPRYLKNMFLVGVGWLGESSNPITEGIQFLKRNQKQEDEQKKTVVKGIIIGILISIMILFVVLPLLLSSDMIFTNLFHKMFAKFDFSNVNIGTPVLIFIFFMIGFISCYAFFKTLCKNDLDMQEMKKPKQCHPVTGITINTVLAVVYVTYCFVQILYLFIGFENGLPDGVTYSEYARSGFWELLFVSFINFFLVVICTYIFEENKILKVLLLIISGCTFIMIGSSAYRMILYVQQYHLTFLRILVLWFLSVAAIFMVGVLISICKRKFPLFRYIVLALMCCYIGLNYIRPDVLIAKYNLSQKCIESQEVLYLFENLSDDAIPVLAEFDMEKVEFYDEADKEYLQIQVDSYMNYVSEENEGIYFRKANYSRIMAKRAADKYQKK